MNTLDHTLGMARNLISLSLLAVVIGNASCQQAPPKSTEHNIPIKVAIIYNFGGAQPVAREDFYLLTKDAVQAWKGDGLLKTDERTSLNDTMVFRLEFLGDRWNVSQGKPSKFAAAITPYVVKTVTTDFEGNATFESIPEGEYYIYGITQTRGGYAVWSYKVSTQENKTVLLDNKNAVYVW